MARPKIMMGQTDHITITFLGPHPSDHGRVRVRVAARVSSLRCACEMSLPGASLPTFHEALMRMDADLKSGFALDFDSGGFLRGSVNGPGHVLLEFALGACGQPPVLRSSDPPSWKALGHFVCYPEVLGRTIRQCGEVVRLWEQRGPWRLP